MYNSMNKYLRFGLRLFAFFLFIFGWIVFATWADKVFEGSLYEGLVGAILLILGFVLAILFPPLPTKEEVAD
jgi:hypothetical protein